MQLCAANIAIVAALLKQRERAGTTEKWNRGVRDAGLLSSFQGPIHQINPLSIKPCCSCLWICMHLRKFLKVHVVSHRFKSITAERSIIVFLF